MAVLALLAAAWSLSRWILPALLEGMARARLSQAGVSVTALPVDSVGWSTTTVGPGSLEYAGTELRWESAQAAYRPEDLLDGRIRHLTVEQPEVILRMPGPLPVGQAGGVPVESQGPPPVPSREPEASREPGRPAPGAKADQTASPMAVVPPYPVLADWIASLPADGMTARKGRISLALPGLTELSGEWEADLLQSASGLTGTASGTLGPLQTDLRILSLSALEMLSARGSLEVALPELEPLVSQGLEHLLPQAELPRISLAGMFKAEGLAELGRDAQPAFSAQGNWDSVRLNWPGKGPSLEFLEGRFAASHTTAGSRFSAGWQVGSGVFRNARSEPFAVTLSLSDLRDLELETETIAFAFSGLSWQAALRGKATLDKTGLPTRYQLEVSLKGPAGPPFGVEPFSAFLQGGPEGASLELSPLGLRRSGTVWIEQARLAWDFAAARGDLGLEWYGPSGAKAGSISGQILGNTDYRQVNLLCRDTGGQVFLELELQDGPEQSLRAEGVLDLPWINVLTQWAGWAPGLRLSGKAPAIQADLAGPLPFPKGSLELDWESLDLETPDGLRVEGLAGGAAFLFNRFPRTREPQLLQAEVMRFGGLRFEKLKLEWELPTYRHFRILALEMQVGGGLLVADPFVMDPIEPAPRTRIRIRNLAANQVLDWLEEDRFRIAGTVSGSLAVGWEDGTLLLGSGELQLDDGAGDRRFRFEDESLVRQQVQALGSIPEDLRERLLKALLEEGIRLESLTVAFRETEDPSQVSLRFSLSGESSTDELQVPIRGLVIDNRISRQGLARLLGLAAPVRFETDL